MLCAHDRSLSVNRALSIMSCYKKRENYEKSIFSHTSRKFRHIDRRIVHFIKSDHFKFIFSFFYSCMSHNILLYYLKKINEKKSH